MMTESESPPATPWIRKLVIPALMRRRGRLLPPALP